MRPCGSASLLVTTTLEARQTLRNLSELRVQLRGGLHDLVSWDHSPSGIHRLQESCRVSDQLIRGGLSRGESRDIRALVDLST
jgi:hypothetical protein